MNETIDSKAGFGRRSGMSLIELMIGCAVAATVAAVGMSGQSGRVMKEQSARIVNAVTSVSSQSPSYSIRYESVQAQQLADSAIRRYTGSKRDSERYRMDKNQDGLITEDEVIAYVRAK